MNIYVCTHDNVFISLWVCLVLCDGFGSIDNDFFHQSSYLEAGEIFIMHLTSTSGEDGDAAIAL